MPQRRTAKKELRKSKKKSQRNLLVKYNIKNAIKKLKKALQENDIKKSKQTLQEVYKALDKAATKKVIHPNKAARRKSRLSKLLPKK